MCAVSTLFLNFFIGGEHTARINKNKVKFRKTLRVLQNVECGKWKVEIRKTLRVLQNVECGKWKVEFRFAPVFLSKLFHYEKNLKSKRAAFPQLFTIHYTLFIIH